MTETIKRKFNRVIKLTGGLFLACFLSIMLSGCWDEHVNPLGSEKFNGEAPKEEAYAVQMDCKGIYNGEYLPKFRNATSLHQLRFTGDWEQLHNSTGSTVDWYMAMTSEVGARVDLCATMTRCIFDFWDYEFYDNPGKIQILLDDKVVGTCDLSRKNPNGFKVLDYVVATQKNTVATASIVLLSGRMVLTGVQANIFNVHWPY